MQAVRITTPATTTHVLSHNHDHNVDAAVTAAPADAIDKEDGDDDDEVRDDCDHASDDIVADKFQTTINFGPYVSSISVARQHLLWLSWPYNLSWSSLSMVVQRTNMAHNTLCLVVARPNDHKANAGGGGLTHPTDTA